MRPTSKWHKTAKVRLLQLCEAIISCSNFWSGWGLKQSCSSCQKLSNGVSHPICTHRSWADSRLFLVPAFLFAITCVIDVQNGSCEPILDIYTLIAFQWYKKILNTRCSDFCNRSLEVQKSTGTPTPKRRAHLGVWIFILTFFLARALETLLPWSRAQG
jgi:hypothetical protein